jgi:hypothetical protein
MQHAQCTPSMTSAIKIPLNLNPGQILFLKYLKAENINTEILTDFKRQKNYSVIEDAFNPVTHCSV